MIVRSAGLKRSHVADALTASRFVIALTVAPIVGRGAWLAASLLVAAAWWTDFLDGRVARTTSGTRLGCWDPHADTAVGLGIVVGLAGGGHVLGPAWWVVGAGLFTLAYLVTGIFAFSESVQALGYGPLLWLTAANQRLGFAMLVGTIAAILILDIHRFRTYTLPAFFDGLRGLARRGRRRRSM